MEIKAGQVFVWAYRYQREYYAQIFLALEDRGVKKDGDFKFRAKILGSTDKTEVIGSELLINPDKGETLYLETPGDEQRLEDKGFFSQANFDAFWEVFTNQS